VSTAATVHIAEERGVFGLPRPVAVAPGLPTLGDFVGLVDGLGADEQVAGLAAGRVVARVQDVHADHLGSGEIMVKRKRGAVGAPMAGGLPRAQHSVNLSVATPRSTAQKRTATVLGLPEQWRQPLRNRNGAVTARARRRAEGAGL